MLTRLNSTSMYISTTQQQHTMAYLPGKGNTSKMSLSKGVPALANDGCLKSTKTQTLCSVHVKSKQPQ